MIAYVAAVVGVVIVATLVKKAGGHDDYFRADKAMFYIVLLTIGYLGSRGLAKAGSNDNYDERGDRGESPRQDSALDPPAPRRALPAQRGAGG